jgi:DNA-binding CsgD family transcriptional regulator
MAGLDVQALGGYPYSFEVDADGTVLRVLSASPAFAQLIGDPDAPLGYLELVAHIHPEDRVGPYPPEALESGRWQAELRAVGADGTEGLVWDISAMRTRDPATGRMIWDGAVFDVTGRRQPQAVAAQAASQIDRTLAAVQTAVVELDLPGRGPPRITFTTPSAGTLVGIDGPLTFGALRSALVPEDTRLLAEHLEVLASGRAVHGEYRLASPRIGGWIQARLAASGHRRGVGVLHRTEPAAGDAPRLTARQAEILTRIAAGRRTREIAAELSISPATVRNHTTAILAALGARSRLEAVAAARQAGLL